MPLPSCNVLVGMGVLLSLTVMKNKSGLNKIKVFLCHLRVVCGYFEILPYHIIQGPRLHLVYFSHSHGPRWLNIPSMSSTVGRTAGKDGTPSPSKGMDCPEFVYITFQNI